MCELVNCPTCKGKCEIKKVSGRINAANINKYPYYVECLECHASTGEFFESKEAAASFWNTRNEHRQKPIAGCPVCGAGSGVLRMSDHPVGWGIPAWYIFCYDCGFRTWFFDTPEEAINSWNGDTSEEAVG